MKNYMEQRGDSWTKAGGVCLAKEAVRRAVKLIRAQHD
jgi:hypothetical protein